MIKVPAQPNVIEKEMTKMPELIDDRELVKLSRDLVTHQSVNPYIASRKEGRDDEMPSFLASRLREYGFNVELQPIPNKKYYTFSGELIRPPRRYNVIARMPSLSRRTKLVLNGHYDTVSGMNMKDAFSARIDGNRMHGRGTSDMKAPIAAMIMGAKAVMDSGIPLNGTATLALVTDEETWGMGSKTFVQSEKADFAIIGEPTNNKLSPSQAGFIDFNIYSRGESRHGSTVLVDSWSTAMINVMELAHRIYSDPILREPVRWNGMTFRNTVNLAPTPTRLYTSYAWMTVEEFRINMMIGTAPQPSRARTLQAQRRIIDRIKSLLKRSNRKGQRNKFELNAVNHGFVQPRNKYVRAFEKAMDKTQGSHPIAHTYSFCDGTFFKDAGIPTILYGPGVMELGHSNHEYIDLRQIKQAARTYAYAIANILS